MFKFPQYRKYFINYEIQLQKTDKVKIIIIIIESERKGYMKYIYGPEMKRSISLNFINIFYLSTSLFIYLDYILFIYLLILNRFRK